VIFFDDPLQVLDSLLSVVGDAVTAIRGLTAALSRLAVIGRTPETLLIDRAAIGDSSASLRAVTTHLLPRPSRRLPAPLPLPHPRPLKLVPEVITIGQQVLQPMAGLIRGVTSGPIVWPRTCFYDGSRPDQAVPAEIEVAGPARTLVYGPYFYLPPGTWRITALLSFSEYACTNSYMMDVFTDVQLAKVQLCPPDDGEWMASWMFENTHWQRQIEVRLFVERGAIEGRVALRQVNLEPLGNSE
jgi:hypothetical protein